MKEPYSKTVEKIYKLANELQTLNPVVLLQQLGYELIFTDVVKAGIESWVEPDYLPNVILFTADLEKSPLIYGAAARELVKVVHGVYDTDEYFTDRAARQRIDGDVNEIAQGLKEAWKH